MKGKAGRPSKAWPKADDNLLLSLTLDLPILPTDWLEEAVIPRLSVQRSAQACRDRRDRLRSDGKEEPSDEESLQSVYLVDSDIESHSSFGGGSKRQPISPRRRGSGVKAKPKPSMEEQDELDSDRADSDEDVEMDTAPVASTSTVKDNGKEKQHVRLSSIASSTASAADGDTDLQLELDERLPSPSPPRAEEHRVEGQQLGKRSPVKARPQPSSSAAADATPRADACPSTSKVPLSSEMKSSTPIPSFASVSEGVPPSPTPVPSVAAGPASTKKDKGKGKEVEVVILSDSEDEGSKPSSFEAAQKLFKRSQVQAQKSRTMLETMLAEELSKLPPGEEGEEKREKLQREYGDIVAAWKKEGSNSWTEWKGSSETEKQRKRRRVSEDSDGDMASSLQR